MADVVKTHVARTISVIKRPNEWFRGMARHPEVCCIALAFLITLAVKYGSSSVKSKLVTSPPRQPHFLFLPSSFVMDSPRGSLAPLINILHQEEFVFVMYYAPWCSKSQAARTEFLKAANYFKGQVKFAAVNCWWPEGECRKRYKFLMFPVFMAYHTKLDGYRYFGITRAEHLIKFVEDILHPVAVVHSRSEALELVVKHDTVVLGYFNLSSEDNIGSYRQFYFASMRILERDPLQPVKFAVVLDCGVAKGFSLIKFEDIVMLRIANSSLIFPYGKNITCHNLVNWSLWHKGMNIVKRLSPEGLKSQALAEEMNKGPALIMFHIENPLYHFDYGLTVLKSLVLHYKDCVMTPALRGLQSAWSRIVAKGKKDHDENSQMCENVRRSKQSSKSFLSCCVSALVQSISETNSQMCDICHVDTRSCSLLQHHLSSVLNQSQTLNCRNVILNYSWEDTLSVCCHFVGQSVEANYPSNGNCWLRPGTETNFHHYLSHHTTSSRPVRRSTDRYIRHHLENLPTRLCDKLSLEKQQGLRSPWMQDWDGNLDPARLDENVKHFSNIGCASNKSLSFYAMDSKNHWMFSDVLGLEPDVSSSRPTAILFDKQNEEHYIMKTNLTFSNTMSFILDFEFGHLKRHKQRHSFHQPACQSQKQVCVRELDGQSLLNLVKVGNQDVVLLVYAHWCGFCQTFSHTFLSLAQYFQPSKHITFARINGVTNDLPWEYTFDHFPTLLFFPAKRKPDSVMFPLNQDMTLTRLISFVLRHSTYDTRLDLAADVCTKACIQQNLLKSSQLLKTLTSKQARLQMKFLSVSNTLTEEAKNGQDGDSSRSHYSKLALEFFSQRLKDTQSSIENVKKLIHYLKAAEGGEVRKQDLIDLFGRKTTKTRA